MSFSDAQATGATPSPVSMEPTAENIAIAQEATRVAYAQVIHLRAQMQEMRREMDAARNAARTNWEWVLNNTPTPDYTHDREALTELVRYTGSYGSDSVGHGVLRDWVASFGGEFTLGSLGANRGPNAYLPSVSIRVRSYTDFESMTERVLALAEAIGPKLGPVIFEIDRPSSEERWFLFGPDDENYEDWTIHHGRWEGDTMVSEYGDLDRLLRYIAAYL